MTTETDIFTLIQREFDLDHKIKAVFENACKAFGWTLPPNEILDKWLSYFDEEKFIVNDEFETYQATNEDQLYLNQLDLLHQISKTPWFKFSQLIKDGFKSGKTREEMYDDFCRSMNYELVDRKEVTKCFKHYIFNWSDIDPHKPLAKIIHKNYWPELFEMVMTELLSGKTRDDAFQLSCQKLGYDLISEDKVKRWFKDFCLPNSSIYYDEEIKLKYQHLMEQITVRYWILKKGIYCWKSKNGHEPDSILPNQSRHGIGFKWQEDKLLFFDYFHGIERDITFENYSIVWEDGNYSGIEIYPISQNRLLLYKHDIEWTFPSILYLVEIDFKNWTCKILDQHDCGSLNQTFVLDHKDKSKFVIFYNKEGDDDWAYIKTGQVVGDKIHSQANVAKTEQNLLCPKLEGNILTGFYTDSTRDPKWFSSWQYDLDKKQLYKSKQKIAFLFDSDLDAARSNMADPRCPKYTWSDSTCYTIVNNSNNQWLIYAFNFDTFQCTLVDIVVCRIYSLFVDQNEVLTVYADKAVFRLSLRQPESLKTIVWLNIRRQTLFFKNDLYSQAMKTMPPTYLLPSFYEHDSVENN